MKKLFASLIVLLVVALTGCATTGPVSSRQVIGVGYQSYPIGPPMVVVPVPMYPSYDYSQREAPWQADTMCRAQQRQADYMYRAQQRQADYWYRAKQRQADAVYRQAQRLDDQRRRAWQRQIDVQQRARQRTHQPYHHR